MNRQIQMRPNALTVAINQILVNEVLQWQHEQDHQRRLKQHALIQARIKEMRAGTVVDGAFKPRTDLTPEQLTAQESYERRLAEYNAALERGETPLTKPIAPAGLVDPGPAIPPLENPGELMETLKNVVEGSEPTLQ